MWPTGIVIGSVAFVIGILMLVFPGRVASVLQKASLIRGDKRPERFTPALVVAPAIVLLIIAIVILLLGMFGNAAK